MTKVEELRYEFYSMEKSIGEKADSLIAAAEAQGVEKGAEQMKQRIRNTCDFIAQGDEVSCTDVHYAKCVDNTEQDFAEAQTDLYVVPASVLSPAPKEKK